MISINQTTKGKRKDTAENIEQTGEFVYNMCTYDLRQEVNKSAAELPPEIDEFELVGVTKVASIKVKPFRVGESPVQFECVYTQTIRLPGAGAQGTVDVIIGKVVMVHIKDDVITDGRIDIPKIRPLARLGYWDYTTVDSSFEMVIPGDNDDLLVGLQGAKQEK
jgi:flavin reductase (DIM6/NTAB) family NADH-FMN oxidoreductase RutF